MVVRAVCGNVSDTVTVQQMFAPRYLGPSRAAAAIPSWFQQLSAEVEDQQNFYRKFLQEFNANSSGVAVPEGMIDTMRAFSRTLYAARDEIYRGSLRSDTDKRRFLERSMSNLRLTARDLTRQMTALKHQAAVTRAREGAFLESLDAVTATMGRSGLDDEPAGGFQRRVRGRRPSSESGLAPAQQDLLPGEFIQPPRFTLMARLEPEGARARDAAVFEAQRKDALLAAAARVRSARKLQHGDFPTSGIKRPADAPDSLHYGAAMAFVDKVGSEHAKQKDVEAVLEHGYDPAVGAGSPYHRHNRYLIPDFSGWTKGWIDTNMFARGAAIKAQQNKIRRSFQVHMDAMETAIQELESALPEDPRRSLAAGTAAMQGLRALMGTPGNAPLVPDVLTHPTTFKTWQAKLEKAQAAIEEYIHDSGREDAKAISAHFQELHTREANRKAAHASKLAGAPALMRAQLAVAAAASFAAAGKEADRPLTDEEKNFLVGHALAKSWPDLVARRNRLVLHPDKFSDLELRDLATQHFNTTHVPMETYHKLQNQPKYQRLVRVFTGGRSRNPSRRRPSR